MPAAKNTAEKKHQFITGLKEGEQVAGRYLVVSKNFQEYKDKTKGQFLTLVLSDRSGQIPAVLWEGGERLEGRVGIGDLVTITGKTSVFRGNLQIYLDQLDKAAGEFDKSIYLPATPYDLNELKGRLRRIIGAVKNPPLAGILEAFFDDRKWFVRFCDSPAGYSWHQAYLGGLLEHTVNIAEMAQELCRKYQDLDQDLLLTGALLHDIGKMDEYTYETSIGISDEGRLLGHIIIGDEWVAGKMKEIKDFPEELAWQLRHLIISHHGEKASGSPKRPKTAEAAALHLLDNLDAQVSAYLSIIKKVRAKGKTWSDYIKLIDRPLFAGGMEKGSEILNKILPEESNHRESQGRPSLFSE